MRPAKSSTRSWCAAAIVAVTTLSGGLVAAQSAPDGENGRYSMTPIPEGVLRLDTRTGTVSTCSNNGAGWACYAVPDERSALDAEIGRLQTELEKLKGQLAAGPTVSGKIVEQGRGKKVTVLKYKKTNQYKIQRGHRQNYTAVQVSDIKV